MPKTLSFKLPFLRRIHLMMSGPDDAALHPSGLVFGTKLLVAHFRYTGNPKDPHRLIDHRDLGSGLVTNAGVALLAADWTNSTATLKLMNFHDSGTGTNAAAVTDTGLQTQAGPATRATGTQSNTTNVYKTVGTINYTSTLAITEFGLFSQAAQGGTLWDRKTFGSISVISGDAIQFSYSLTCSAGG